MRQIRAATIVVAGLTAAPAYAGTYTVKDDGSGDFDSVQSAVDTVPEGSTLLLTGSFPEKVSITKSLRLVGGTIYAPPGAGDLIHIEGVDWVILDGVTVPGSEGSSYDSHGHGIHVLDARFVVLQNTTVEGQLYDSDLDGGCGLPFPSGFDAVWLERVGYARITSCQLFGAAGTEQYAFGDPGFCGEYDIQGGVGGVGLRVDQSFVVVEDTLAIGGDGGDASWNDWVGLNQPPTSLVGGDGGNGVSGSIWSDGCVFVAGAGGTWKYGPGANWGIGVDGNPGIPVSGTNTQFALPEKLVVTDLVVGQPATVSGQGFALSSIALLFLALDVDPPLGIRQGSWMLEPTWIYVGTVPTDGAGSFAVQATVPNDPSLVALLFFLQSADLTTISEPQELIVSD